MIARIARWGGVVTASACLILSAQATALAAEGETPGLLTLDRTFTAASGKTIEAQPESLRNCGQFPEGAKKDTDGWLFDQPVGEATTQVYVIGLIETVAGKANPVLIALLGDQIRGIAINDETLKGNFGPQDLVDPPAGVSAGLVDGGAWLATPHGWRLASGALLVDPPGSGVSTFSLTAVCLPPSTPPSSSSSSPSASPSVTRSSPATPSPSASTSSAPPAAAGLPITGSPTGALALAGVLAVAAGVLLLAVRRRKLRFRA